VGTQFEPMSLLPLHVRVPASTSNLGPGFDCVGLALALFVDVTLLGESSTGATHFESRTGTALAWPSDGGCLVAAFDRAMRDAGKEPRPMSWRVDSQIPIGFGLGSTGAATAAGLLLGYALAHNTLDVEPRVLITAGVELEGHPDNSSASLLGGCTLAIKGEGRWHVIEHPISAEIGLALAWPSTPFDTRLSRGALPDNVSYADAVDQPRRFAFLLAGLASADPALLKLGSHERLHQPYRLPRIPGAVEVFAAAEKAGAWITTISGAGSGVVALASHAKVPHIATAMEAAYHAVDPPANARVLDIVRDAPNVTSLA
jgi:homoserine kinase